MWVCTHTPRPQPLWRPENKLLPCDAGEVNSGLPHLSHLVVPFIFKINFQNNTFPSGVLTSISFLLILTNLPPLPSPPPPCHSAPSTLLYSPPPTSPLEILFFPWSYVPFIVSWPLPTFLLHGHTYITARAEDLYIGENLVGYVFLSRDYLT